MFFEGWWEVQEWLSHDEVTSSVLGQPLQAVCCTGTLCKEGFFGWMQIILDVKCRSGRLYWNLGSKSYKFSQIERKLFVQELVHGHRNCMKSFYFLQFSRSGCWEDCNKGEDQFLTNKEKYQQWTHVKAPPTSHRHQPVKLTARSTQHPKLTKVTEGGL